jgi:nicotinamide phosphoribosyltransferase
VPEGTVVGTHNVLMVIESLDPECAWLTNFLETILLQVWYPITVATLSREVRKIVDEAYRNCTSYDDGLRSFLVDFVLNDFGFRGVSSVESAGIGGSAHLVNFRGSDTLMGSKFIVENYNTDTIYGLSIPATEHSIMTLRGEEGELDLMKRVLTLFPTGIVACVSDSFNIFRACKDYWGGELKELILSRPTEPGNQLVIRPDSGHVINSLREIFHILFEQFGYTVNEKGYKVLPPQVRVIQGDGINLESIKEIYALLEEEKISPENLALGMGGKLLQAGIDRDTQNFATKACFAVLDGKEVDVVKAPTEMDADGNITKSFKKSKKGRLKLVKNEDGTYRTVTSSEVEFDTVKDELVEVFNMGKLTHEWSFEQVREKAKL